MTPITLEGLQGAITDVWEETHTPSDLKAKLQAFGDTHRAGLADLGITAVNLACGWVFDTVPPEDAEANEIGLRLAAMQLQSASAMLIYLLKRKQGEPFSPARFAIVAFDLATLAEANWAAFVEAGGEEPSPQAAEA